MDANNPKDELNNTEATAPRNPELVEAMQRVASSDNRETRKALYAALLQASFLFPVTEPPRTEGTGSGATTSIRPFVLTNPEGRKALPVFTDTDSLAAWGQASSGFVVFSALDLFSMALGSDVDAVVVNPAGPTGGEISRRELAMLAQGTVPEDENTLRVTEDTQVLVAAPADPPQQVISHLATAAAAHPEIEAVYLALVTIGRGEPHLSAGVQFSQPPNERALRETMRQLSDAVHPSLAPDQYIDFLAIEDTPFSRAVQSSGIEIYRRQARMEKQTN